MTTIASKIAKEMWERDGKPERDPHEPTSVGREWYEARAREVVESAKRVGYVLRRKDGGART